ncbi:MAG: EamA family transporter [Burkholderiales bacterium]
MNNISLYLASVLIWGSTWLVITFQFGKVATEVSVFYRFAIATAILLLFCVLRGLSLRYTKREHFYIALQGMFNFAPNYVMIYYAEQYVSSGLVALVFTAMIPINIIGARLFFGDAITRNVFTGAALGLLGIGLVFAPEMAQLSVAKNAALGLVLSLAGAACASAGNLFAVRNYRAGLPVIQCNALGMFYGTLAIGLFALAMGHEFNFEATPKYVISLIYLSLFGTVFAFSAYMTLMKRIGAGRASYVAVLVPIVALLLSTIFEHFTWHVTTVIGVALCIAGNALILAKR